MYTKQTRDLRFNKTNYDHDISIYTMLHSLISSRCRYKKFANALLNLNAVTYFHKSIYNSVSFTCNKQMKSMLFHQNSFCGSNTLFEKNSIVNVTYLLTILPYREYYTVFFNKDNLFKRAQSFILCSKLFFLTCNDILLEF